MVVTGFYLFPTTAYRQSSCQRLNCAVPQPTRAVTAEACVFLESFKKLQPGHRRERLSARFRWWHEPCTASPNGGAINNVEADESSRAGKAARARGAGHRRSGTRGASDARDAAAGP